MFIAIGFILLAVAFVIWRITTGGQGVWFSTWIGLTAAERTSVRGFRNSIGIAVMLILLPPIILLLFPGIFPEVSEAFAERFDETGFVISFVIFQIPFGIIPNAYSAFFDELIFRGFVGKRLVGKLGFMLGNTIQAVIFTALPLFGLLQVGLVHAVAYYGTVFIAIYAFVFGWLMGYITEKQAGGSIWPAIILHFAFNFITPTLTVLILALRLT